MFQGWTDDNNASLCRRLCVHCTIRITFKSLIYLLELSRKSPVLSSSYYYYSSPPSSYSSSSFSSLVLSSSSSSSPSRFFGFNYSHRFLSLWILLVLWKCTCELAWVSCKSSYNITTIFLWNSRYVRACIYRYYREHKVSKPPLEYVHFTVYLVSCGSNVYLDLVIWMSRA